MAWWAWTLYVTAAALGGAALLVLYSAVFRDRARGRARCPKCWYDMSGAQGLVCPECGRDAGTPRRLLKTRRRWGRAAGGLCLVALAYGAALAPDAIRSGSWFVIVPRPAAMAVLPLFDSWGDTLLRSAGTRPGAAASLSPWERMLLARACAREMESPALTASAGAPVPALMAPVMRRARASGVLMGLGEEAGAAVPILARMLRHGDREQRAVAAQVLGDVGGTSRAAVDAMVLALNDPECDVRERVIAALGSIAGRGYVAAGPLPMTRELRAIAGALKDRERGPRIAAAEALMLLSRTRGLPPELLAGVVESVRDPRLSTGGQGVQAAASFGEPSVPALIEFLSHPAQGVRRAAAAWIGQAGREVRGGQVSAATSALSHLLVDEDRQTRVSALLALSRIGPGARGALGDVERCCRTDSSPSVRLAALIAAEKLAGEEAAPVLTAALEDSSPVVRKGAVEALNRSGPAAPELEPKLRALLSDPDPDVRGAAATALKGLGVGGDR